MKKKLDLSKLNFNNIKNRTTNQLLIAHLGGNAQYEWIANGIHKLRDWLHKKSYGILKRYVINFFQLDGIFAKDKVQSRNGRTREKFSKIEKQVFVHR